MLKHKFQSKYGLLLSVLETMAGNSFCPGVQYHTKFPAREGAVGDTNVTEGIIIL